MTTEAEALGKVRQAELGGADCVNSSLRWGNFAELEAMLLNQTGEAAGEGEEGVQLSLDQAVHLCLAGDETGPRGGFIELEAGQHGFTQDDSVLAFGEIHLRGVHTQGGPGQGGSCRSAGGAVVSDDGGAVGDEARRDEVGNGKRRVGNRRRDMRERKREIARALAGQDGAVISGRWGFTDKSGVGSMGNLTVEDDVGPTVAIMAGTWSFDEVTFRAIGKHNLLLCVTDAGEALATKCTFDGILLDEERTEGFGVCADSQGLCNVCSVCVWVGFARLNWLAHVLACMCLRFFADVLQCVKHATADAHNV